MTEWMNKWLIAVFCWMIFMPVPYASAQSSQTREEPRITLRMREASLPEVLAEIERQAGVTFSYESSLLKELPKISFQVKDEALTDCLARLFGPYPVVYKVSGKIVILKRRQRQVTISGFVRDQTSSESLIGASVYEVASRKGAATNGYGFFSLTLPPGDVRLHASYIGYESRSFHFPELEGDTILSIELRPNARLEEVVVTASERDRLPVNNTLMGAMEFSQKTLKATPTLFGESDIVKTLQLTPGVASGTEGLAGLYVRGGDQDGNLFLIDGNPVYQVNHVGGLFSAFNPEAIRGLDFFKAGFPARYGGRLSSVVDVHTKEGNMKEYHGSATIGLISGNLSLEGPIVKDRTAFHVVLRRSWLDVLSAPAIAVANKIQKKDGYRMNLRYAFHDFNLKLNHRFNDRSRMFLSLYNGNDVLKGGGTNFSTSEAQTPYTDGTHSALRWGNLMGTLGWTYVFNNRLFGRVSGVFSRYRSNIRSSKDYSYGVEGEDNYLSSSSETSSSTSILDMGVRSSFDYTPSTSHLIRFGGDFLVHRFRPEYNEVKASGSGRLELSNIGKVYTNDLLWAREAAVFGEDDWTVSPSLRLNAGLRFSLFNVERKTYTLLEPRASLRWLLRDDLSFKASYARMGQYIHLLGNSYINLPTDAWMPVTRKLKPLISDQVSAGVYYNLMRSYSFSVEGYYKWMKNLLDYKDGYSFLPGTAAWEDKMAVGTGRSYGVEFLARKESGRTTGWVGYTLSWSDRRFDEIDDGRRFPARYDNRHKLNIVVSHKLSERVELTAAWTYASGNRMTLSLEGYEQAGTTAISDPHRQDNWSEPSGGVVDLYTHRNNYQMPAYHRLDLGLNIYRPKKKGRMGIWNISIYNVYSRMNPFMVYKGESWVPANNLVPGSSSPSSGQSKSCFKQIGIMPIIPSVSYTYKF
ncbi:MAG: TonB-dependent receptor [Parabacteroides sp.]|nr:TonB-dependent receptor [Parabacteroides sp.]